MGTSKRDLLADGKAPSDYPPGSKERRDANTAAYEEAVSRMDIPAAIARTIATDEQLR